jgi:hypothetical protein
MEVVEMNKKMGEPDLLPREGKVYCLSFRIRKEFFERVLKGTKTYEIRRASDFWNARMITAMKLLHQGATVKAVIVCGDRTLYKLVKNITYYCGNGAPDLPVEELETVLPGRPMDWRFWRVNYVE